MKRNVVLLALLCWGCCCLGIWAALARAPVPPQAEPAKPLAELPDLSGYWSCQGKQATGEPYSMLLVLRKQRAGIYSLLWVGESGVKAIGTGMQDDREMIVGWRDSSLTGVLRFRVEQGGKKLVGRGANSSGVMVEETLLWIRALE
jgi:hypothetical protein